MYDEIATYVIAVVHTTTGACACCGDTAPNTVQIFVKISSPAPMSAPTSETTQPERSGEGRPSARYDRARCPAARPLATTKNKPNIIRKDSVLLFLLFSYRPFMRRSSETRDFETPLLECGHAQVAKLVDVLP